VAPDLDGAFFADILEHPGDRAARLIYADWLDEHRGDDPLVRDRVHFIRAQCTHESTDPGDPAHRIAKLEADALLAKHRTAWISGLPGFVRDWKFRAGFVEDVQAAPGVLVEHGERLCRLIPLRGLSLRQASGGWARLMRCPLLARIEDLEINSTFQGRSDWLDRLVASPYPTRLRRLVLDRNPLPERAGTLLGNAPTLPALAELVFRRCAALEALAALGSSPLARQIRGLTLPAAGQDQGQALASLCSGEWPALRRVQLSGLSGLPEAPRLLASAPWLAGVEELRVESSRFFEGGLRTLLENSRLGDRLRELTLDGCSGPRIDTLNRIPLERWPDLRVLRLGMVRPGLVLDALERGPRPARLHTLEVNGIDLRREELDRVLDLLGRIPLRSLAICHTGLEDPEVQRLAACPGLVGIQHLDLSGTYFTDRGANALVESPHAAGLLTLIVRSCGFLTPGGRRRLAARFPVVEYRG
jgi:uncharacterized protein (TIGR02996 family)